MRRFALSIYSPVKPRMGRLLGAPEAVRAVTRGPVPFSFLRLRDPISTPLTPQLRGGSLLQLAVVLGLVVVPV